MNQSEMFGFSRAAAVCALFAVCFVAFAIAGTTPEGKAWLAMKEKEDGVVATGSGLLYVPLPYLYLKPYLRSICMQVQGPEIRG